MNDSPPIVMVFAATDPTSGAGLQADIMTLVSMGCHPVSVVTAITVQDTTGVDTLLPIDPEWIADQARCILEDMPVSAFKVGVLGSIEAVAAVAEVVADYPEIPLILDPVLASGRGDELATEDILSAIHDLLLPQATIVTPNSIEAHRLAVTDEDETPPDLAECARRILDTGCEYVLITGTHVQTDEVINTLYSFTGVERTDAWPRLPGSYHGSGCTLASAIAATIANGVEIQEAVRDAQEFTWQTLKHAFHPGMGQYIPDRLFWARDEDNDTETATEPADADPSSAA